MPEKVKFNEALDSNILLNGKFKYYPYEMRDKKPWLKIL